MVHHDLWDLDLPCPPNLVTVAHDGRRIDAVAQVTKMGHLFLLDREAALSGGGAPGSTQHPGGRESLADTALPYATTCLRRSRL